MLRLIAITFITCSLFLSQVSAQHKAGREQHRPQFHHSPTKDWMNDPNGMVFFEGEYHLFFQHDKYEKVFGNMSWGHAISTDLVHWTEYPDPIVPDGDSLGLIFSGSTVIDKENTAGFGINAFVAVYTNTKPQQQQSIAYSTDKGRTWTKYNQNPVIKNEKGDSIPDDFRDPKVAWNKTARRWIMSLAVQYHIEFWSSENLKDWKKESEFGKGVGAHGGVWECPDLFELPVNGDHNNKKWVLLVSINPGGPNGGSATQYFIGDFDGKTFRPASTQTRWIDWGTDDYAAVTWSNTGERKVLIGWMSNWQYANRVPTYPWRGANTIPRELALQMVEQQVHLTSLPVKELDLLNAKSISLKNLKVKGSVDLTAKTGNSSGLFRLDFTAPSSDDFSVILSNKAGSELIIGYSATENQFYIDRSRSGKVDFESGFGKKHIAPRIAKDGKISFSLIADVASVELFADNGLTVMTDIFFPETPMSKLHIKSATGIAVDNLKYTVLKSPLK